MICERSAKGSRELLLTKRRARVLIPLAFSAKMG